MARNQKDQTYDNATRLNDAGAITASAAGLVATVAKVLDFGAAGPVAAMTGYGRVDGRVICDVSALTVSTADNLYQIKTQFSSSATFASSVIGGSVLMLGHATMLVGESAASVIGRYELWFTNEINGTAYRYMRIYTQVAGTTPSINYTAFVANLAY
jgi:hypothetical protein